jgi:hypothetical protein
VPQTWLRPLAVPALALCLAALPALAEIRIKLKNGEVVTLPYAAEEVDSITFGPPAPTPAHKPPPRPERKPAQEPGRRPAPKQPPAPPARGPAAADAGALTSWVELRQALRGALPGQTVTLAPGTYIVGRGQTLDLNANGAPGEPITLRAPEFGAVTIEVETPEAMRIAGAYWVIENLDFLGICGNHSVCEHAFHLKPQAREIVIRNNRAVDFNAAIKGSAADPEGLTGPSAVTVEGNRFYNRTPRQTGNPVTVIDINGGRGWVVRHNYIADFQKAGGDHISYAAFLKRNSFDGLFEGNLVVCEQRHRGGVRLGLSLGGGGAGMPVEHTDGTIRNNIVMNCPADVGIYLNRARNTRIYNNVLYNTVGIDVRYRQSSADIRNNVLSGRIKDRSNGSHVAEANRVGVTPEQFAAWFVDPAHGDFRPRSGAPVIGAGVPAPDVARDFCGRERSRPMDQGAIAAGEGPCALLDELWVED